MATSKGIRWPDDLHQEIEKAMVEDGRRDFSDEVFYLVRLGLEEAKWRRQLIAGAVAERHAEYRGDVRKAN